MHNTRFGGTGLLAAMLFLTACGGSSGSESVDADPGPPGASIDSPSVEEGDTGTVAVTFNITLTAPAPAAASIRYETADGEAIAGEDYIAASGTVNVAAGATGATIAPRDQRARSQAMSLAPKSPISCTEVPGPTPASANRPANVSIPAESAA